jgi:polyisoprenoid-binding protein YceI
MASGKFPKAGFKGKIANPSSIDFSKDGTYSALGSGNLTIRDITKPVVSQGTITIKNGVVTAGSNFKIQRKDFNVIGQSFVQEKNCRRN